MSFGESDPRYEDQGKQARAGAGSQAGKWASLPRKAFSREGGICKHLAVSTQQLGTGDISLEKRILWGPNSIDLIPPRLCSQLLAFHICSLQLGTISSRFWLLYFMIKLIDEED